MGRGRTTTGLIIGCLWCVHRGKVPNYESWLNQDVRRRSFVPGATGPTTGKSLLSPPGPVNVPPLTPQNILPTTSTSSTYMEPSTITGDDEQSTQKRAEEFANGRKHGWYKVIQSLVRLIQDGPQIKRQTDRVIDHSGTFQNLREAIYETQELALTCLPRKKPFFVRRGLNYLIRYFYLILINAYMSQEVAYNFERMSFADWLAKRQELTNLLNSVTFPEEMKAPVEVKPAVKRVAPMSTSPPVVVTPVAK
jgi:hypothetical protein